MCKERQEWSVSDSSYKPAILYNVINETINNKNKPKNPLNKSLMLNKNILICINLTLKIVTAWNHTHRLKEYSEVKTILYTTESVI